MLGRHPPAPTGSPGPSRARDRLQRLVHQIDEMAHVLVLPPCPALVHRVGEGDVGIRIGEPERAAGAEVPEGAGARTEPALRHGELEAETEARRPLENYIF